MARIHLLETNIPNVGDPGIQAGSIRVVYHVNINSQKVANVDASESQDVGQLTPGGRLQSGTVRIGPSIVPGLLTEHPDFPGVAESTALTNQQIAEVEAQIQRNENENLQTIKAVAEGFYAEVEAQAQSLYTQKFDLYSQTTNNIP